MRGAQGGDLGPRVRRVGLFFACIAAAMFFGFLANGVSVVLNLVVFFGCLAVMVLLVCGLAGLAIADHIRKSSDDSRRM